MARRDLSQPISHVTYTVKPAEEGMRLDHWLHKRISWRSRNDLQDRIARGSVLLDGASSRKSTRVQAGQQVRVEVDEGPATQPVPAGELAIDVIFEDRHLVALDKPPGTVVHPVGRHVTDTIINVLHVRFHERGSPADEEPPMIVHRLDQDTSGVLVLAKNEAARKTLGQDFEERRVAKTYLALVEGPVEGDSGTIDRPIGPDPDADIKLKVACIQDGKASRTDYVVVARSPRFTLMRCLPRSGRQHQIRVHLASIGHPILCDRLYGNPDPVTTADLAIEGAQETMILLGRQALHSESLEFKHPATGNDMTLAAPLAADMHTFLRICPGMQWV